LLAAEVSISGLAGKSPRFMSKAKVMLHERRVLPAQLSELAGTVGTLEAIDGTKRAAKNFFEQSLVDPTENAVAQAVWAANERVLPDFDADKFSHLHPAEADAWQARSAMDWDKAIDACYRWADQELFSLTPCTMGSFIASMLERYEDTVRFCTLGLMSNPKSYDMLNNLVVAKLFLGDLDAALLQMIALRHFERNPQQAAVWIATSGLALFCGGQLDEGRDAYRRSIDEALKTNVRETAVFAAAFWVKA